jgi:hypothetical protein
MENKYYREKSPRYNRLHYLNQKSEISQFLDQNETNTQPVNYVKKYIERVFNKNFIHHLIDNVGSSPQLYWIEKNLTSFFFRNRNSLASLEYQELGARSQIEMGIPTDYQVPVLIGNDLSTHLIATTDAYNMKINENILNNFSYSMKKYIFLHESVHKKYNDATMGIVIPISSYIISQPIIRKLLEKKLSLLKLAFIAPVIGFLIAIKQIENYHYYAERRADSEACIALNCHLCIYDAASSLEKHKILLNLINVQIMGILN